MSTVQHGAPAATSKPVDLQRAQFTHFLMSLPASVWAARAMAVLQSLAVPLAFYFKPVCVCVAMFWCVSQTPVHPIGKEQRYQTDHQTTG